MKDTPSVCSFLIPLLHNTQKMSLEEAELEYRSDGDDAWYSVTVVLEENGDVLRVKYCGFSEEHDKVYRGSELKSKSELRQVMNRFRPLSAQLQDSDCTNLSLGDVVCASFSFLHDDVRFYDAVLDGVENREHALKQGGEECLCTFVLEWIHGPNAGNLTYTTIEHICRVRSTAQTDPKLDSFLKRAAERFVITPDPVPVSKRDDTPNIKHKRSFLQRINHDTRRAKRSTVGKIGSSEGRIGSHPESSFQDADFGGGGNQYVILLGNLDKGLSPSMVSEFIKRETFVSPQVYIYPNFTSDTSTQGALMLDCEKQFQKLSEFLDRPNQIIISSGGRPWVVVEKMSGHNPLRASTGIQSQRTLQNGSIGSSNGLKVVYEGSAEYQRAKLLKDLILEFFNHQKRLNKKLALDVENILQRYRV